MLESDFQRRAREWEERARSPYRDFFVASHRGWNDPLQWERQARIDAGFVMARPADNAAYPPPDLDVLEIGCGVGRLAATITPSVASYSGFDVAPSMVAAARCAVPSARFAAGDGRSVPESLRDRQSGLVFALAVFIHCAEETVAALLRDAWPLVRAGGRLRAQFLADEDDAEGYAIPPDTGTADAGETSGDRCRRRPCGYGAP